MVLFRAIFDLSNKIALLILLRMYALYVKKKSKKLKIDWRVIFLAQFMLAQDSAWLSLFKFILTQINSAQLSSNQLDLDQPSLTRLSKAIGSILALKFKRSPFCSNTFEFFRISQKEFPTQIVYFFSNGRNAVALDRMHSQSVPSPTALHLPHHYFSFAHGNLCSKLLQSNPCSPKYLL